MKKETPYLIAYYATLIAIGAMAACLGPVLPALAAQTSVSLKDVSLILALRPLGYMVGSVLAGRLLDRYPGHPILATAMAAAAAFMALIPLAALLGWLSLAVLLMGLADGMLDVGSNTLIAWVYGPRVGPYMNGLHFAFGVGAFGTPLLISRLSLVSGNIHLSFWAISLAMLPLAAFLLRLPSPAHHDADPVSAAASSVKPLTLLIVAIFFAYGATEAGFGNWIYSYVKASGLDDDKGAALLNSLFWGALALGRLAGIAVALRVPAPRILLADAIGGSLSLALILGMPSSHTALTVGALGLGFSMASFFPTLLAHAGRLLAPGGRVSGFTISLFFIGSGTGSIVLPWAIGQGFESIGPRFAIALCLGTWALMTFLASRIIFRQNAAA